MKKIFIVLFLTTGFCGLSTGLFDFTYPVFLDRTGISFKNMGWIFSTSFFFIFFIRIYFGHISDIIGRKFFYSLSLFLLSFAQFTTTFLKKFIPLLVLKSIREIALTLKETFQPVVVYEFDKKKFLNLIGKINGIEFFLAGVGTFIAGFAILKTGAKNTLIISSVPVFFAFMLFYLFYKEKRNNSIKDKKDFHPSVIFEKINNPVLKKIIAVGFIINFGVFISHSFFMPLFFLKKFSVSPFILGIVLALHRVSLGLPLLITGKLVKKYHKKVFLYTIIFQGITISLTVFMPNFLLACIMFLLHDILGASFWQPIYNGYIQKFSREGKRGKDTSVVFAYTSIGKILSPVLAGYLATININFPFFFSGFITIFAFIPILTLPELKTS